MSQKGMKCFIQQTFFSSLYVKTLDVCELDEERWRDTLIELKSFLLGVSDRHV